MKKVVIAGGTGFIGSYLKSRFQLSGFKVLVVSREPKHVQWNLDELTEALNDADLVLNLAGKSVNCRHNKANRKTIIESRVNATNLIGNAIKACEQPPKLWINASATGIYKPSFKLPMTEDETTLGTDFLADVVREWEKTFFEFQLTKTRQIALRTSVVLGRNGGALEPLVKLTQLGLGGKQGNGKQMFSWIHIEDYFRMLLFIIDKTALTGVLNCTAPTPVSNNELMYTLRKKLHLSFGLPAPKLAVKIGAGIMGIESSLILNSSYVVPKRLLEAGFHFNYSSLDIALIDILRSQRT